MSKTTFLVRGDSVANHVQLIMTDASGTHEFSVKANQAHKLAATLKGPNACLHVRSTQGTRRVPMETGALRALASWIETEAMTTMCLRALLTPTAASAR